MLVRNPKGRVVEVPEDQWETLKANGYEMLDVMPHTERHNGPTLSVIVLAWNRLELTQRCIESILQHTKMDFELIVVNNNSTDGTREYLETLAENDQRVRTLHNPTNRGVAGGRNDGIKMAKGLYLAFFDNDSTVGPDWDTTMLGAFERHPHAGFVGHNGTMMHSFTHKGMRSVTLFDQREIRCDLVSGGATMVRKEVFEEVGLLDEWGMGEFWHEDAEICLRAARTGWESYAIKFPWHHEAHSSYRQEMGSAWMDKFQANLDYIKHKMARANEIKILFSRDTYETDLLDFGRAFGQHLTSRGYLVSMSNMPPIIPSSIRRSTAFVIEYKGKRFFYMGVKNDVCPADWEAYLKDEADAVIVPSGLSKSVLPKSISAHVHGVGINTGVFHSQAKPTIILGDELFVFFHYGSSRQRGTDLAIRAFFEEFTHDDKAILVIKTSGITDTVIPTILDELREAGKINAPFVVHSDDWKPTRLAAFMRRSAVKGAFVYPARCETDDIRPMMAHACGARIIGPEYGVLMPNIMADFKLVPSPYLNNPAEPFYTHGEEPKWAECDVASLSRMMRGARELDLLGESAQIPSRVIPDIRDSFAALLDIITP